MYYPNLLKEERDPRANVVMVQGSPLKGSPTPPKNSFFSHIYAPSLLTHQKMTKFMTFAINGNSLKYFPFIFGKGSFMNHSVTKRNSNNRIKFVFCSIQHFPFQKLHLAIFSLPCIAGAGSKIDEIVQLATGTTGAHQRPVLHFLLHLRLGLPDQAVRAFLAGKK